MVLSVASDQHVKSQSEQGEMESDNIDLRSCKDEVGHNWLGGGGGSAL
jgi:hypothetical protein